MAEQDARDETFLAEQAHLSDIYAQLTALRDDLTEEIETSHHGARQDLIDLSEEVTVDFGGADETMETLAAIETLNSVIDTYNKYHDISVEKLAHVLLLLEQPYFAKVTLKMRPGRPPRDVYIGTVGVTDRDANPLVVDWRSPVSSTYYNQEMGRTSYEVNGRTRTVELTCRRQFDIVRDTLRGYFDTTVAIEDALLLDALRRHHSEKLRAITATIQREQNEVIRHPDVPVLLVSGIAGSGKTSVMLQRIAYLLYRQRETLDASQVWLFTPSEVFGRYIDTVLPQLGEANPQTGTWTDWVRGLGFTDRGDGARGDAARLTLLERRIGSERFDERDFRAIVVEGEQLL
ncbi:MAG: UvrD-helicase domain-containing protein, partial [Olegusella sp.]|nr:UvrD-helicase domain-containing protein [Olegusella sp.]